MVDLLARNDLTYAGAAHIGVCLDFGRCAESRNSQDRTYSRFSTSFRSTPRKLCDAWEDAKGCRSNLAKAEGLELPSPRESNYSTTAASCRTAHLPAPAL